MPQEQTTDADADTDAAADDDDDAAAADDDDDHHKHSVNAETISQILLNEPKIEKCSDMNYLLLFSKGDWKKHLNTVSVCSRSEQQ